MLENAIYRHQSRGLRIDPLARRHSGRTRRGCTPLHGRDATAGVAEKYSRASRWNTVTGTRPSRLWATEFGATSPSFERFLDGHARTATTASARCHRRYPCCSALGARALDRCPAKRRGNCFPGDKSISPSALFSIDSGEQLLSGLSRGEDVWRRWPRSGPGAPTSRSFQTGRFVSVSCPAARGPPPSSTVETRDQHPTARRCGGRPAIRFHTDGR